AHASSSTLRCWRRVRRGCRSGRSLTLPVSRTVRFSGFSTSTTAATEVTLDDVIELRALWRKMNYGSLVPDALVLASRDWLAYVQAMTAAVPAGSDITLPSEQDVRWAW